MKPCDACPMTTWAALTDPNNVDRERQIRAEQRRLDMRELQATAKQITWLVDQLVTQDGKAIDHSDMVSVLDRVRSNARRLVITAERKAAA